VWKVLRDVTPSRVGEDSTLPTFDGVLVRTIADALARALLSVITAAAAVAPVKGQSVVDRPPNLAGPWVGAPGVVHFNFLHRFSHSGAPQRKITNYPTFLLAAGFPWRMLIGANYATNSDVANRFPNEWEVFARGQPLSDEGGLLDAAIQGGYNLAAESFDGEVSIAKRVGPVRVIAAGRALSHAYGIDKARFAIAGGGTLRINRWIALAGDAAKLLTPGEADTPEFLSDDVAWSAGLHLAIPYTPHSLSLQASNANTNTLEGATRASGSRRYGFEFTIPITLRRWLPSRATRDSRGATAASSSAPVGTGPVRRASMRALMYAPDRLEVAAGTAIEWKNDDQVAHTLTADDASWDSGMLEPGATWRHTFTTAGSIPFHCAPHPFMKGVVVVR
jgi:plastocyanin